jgi:hypothetical protein
MTLPGFRSETGLYRSSLTYRELAAAHRAHMDLFLAPAVDSCVCTSPNCYWLCPISPPPGCCPPGYRCCGSCATGRCDDRCVRPPQVCP